jgi:hypothetical protein
METLLNKPAIGEGATVSYCADSHAMTIIAVSDNGKTVTVQRDSAKLAAGARAYSNIWETQPNPAGATMVFTLRQNGKYVQQGEPMRSGTKLHIGGRHEYYSYEF